jgi:hypothetical protein
MLRQCGLADAYVGYVQLFEVLLELGELRQERCGPR